MRSLAFRLGPSQALLRVFEIRGGVESVRPSRERPRLAAPVATRAVHPARNVSDRWPLSSLQCKAQPSGTFFPESYFPEIARIVVGVFLYVVERDRRRLPRCARHILRSQCENEGSGIGRPGAVDEAQLAAYVALYIEQFEPLRHLVLSQKVVRWARLSIGNRSTGRKKSRLAPRAHSPNAAGRRVWPAVSSARQSAIRHR